MKPAVLPSRLAPGSITARSSTNISIVILANIVHNNSHEDSVGAQPQPARENTTDSTVAVDPAQFLPAPEPRDTCLQPGLVLENRFLIRKLLGSGGMGEVYEAEDLQLDSAAIALKTIRADYIFNPEVRKRFQREVLLARSIAHPNVCPVYEMFSSQGSKGEICFLTMKLLTGETLASRLERAGPLNVEEVITFGREIGAGLEAAHLAGIVHRDLKPSNIFLEEHRSETRAVVTDFGLARMWDLSGTVSRSGVIVGTLSYIAPEILLGSPATPLSDLYSLGVVLHEMLFARVPNSVLETDAHTETMPSGRPARRLMEVIGRCLETRPERRLQSAAQLIEALETLSSAEPALPTRRQLLAGAAAGITAIAAAGWLSRDSIEDLLHPVPRPRRVAFLPVAMQGASAQDSSLLSGVLDSASSELARAEGPQSDLFILPAHYLRQQNVSGMSDTVGLFGVNLVLSGSIHRVSATVHIALNLISAASRTVIRKASVRCPLDDIYRLPAAVAQQSARLLDLSDKHISTQVSSAGTVNAEAFAAYQQGRDLLYAHGLPNVRKAIEQLQKAVELDSGFARAWACLASAYATLYGLTRDAAALELADRNTKKALELAPQLSSAYASRADLELDRGEYEKAIADLDTALRFDPGDFDAQLTLAHTYEAIGKPDQADRVYSDLLQQRPNNWPALNDWAESYFNRANYVKAEQLFRQATVAAPQAALPWRNLGAVCLETNQLDEADRALKRSLELLPSGEVHGNRGVALFWLGKYREAAQEYRQAVQLNPNRFELWQGLGDCLTMLRGMHSQATAAWEKAAALARKSLEINPRSADTLTTLALLQAKLADKQQAKELLARADRIKPPDADRLFTESMTYELIGERDTALRMLTESVRLGYSRFEIEHATELQNLRKDPRYKALRTQTRREV